jgi:hypothetical protein
VLRVCVSVRLGHEHDARVGWKRWAVEVRPDSDKLGTEKSRLNYGGVGEWATEPAAVVGVHAQPCGVHEGVGYDAQHGWGKRSGVVEGGEFGGGGQRQRWFGDYVEFRCLGQEDGVGGLRCGVSSEGIEAFVFVARAWMSTTATWAKAEPTPHSGRVQPSCRTPGVGEKRAGEGGGRCPAGGVWPPRYAPSDTGHSSHTMEHG